MTFFYARYFYSILFGCDSNFYSRYSTLSFKMFK